MYGVFKLRVAHRRLGYTPIEIEQQVCLTLTWHAGNAQSVGMTLSRTLVCNIQELCGRT